MEMRSGINALFAGAILFVFVTAACGDLIIPTVTHVYFERDGEPYNKSVDFIVSCYGYSFPPGEPHIIERIGRVYSFSASCPQYGCSIHESYYLNYRKIVYCDLVGKTDGKEFWIRGYGSSPVNFSDCIHGNGSNRMCSLRLTIPFLSVYSQPPESGFYESMMESVIMTYEGFFLIALFLTVVIETLTLYILLRHPFKADGVGVTNLQIVFTGVLTSSVTLPYLWFILPRFLFPGFMDPMSLILAGELLVISVEAVIIKQLLKLKINKSLSISSICNLVSFLFGLMFYPLLI